MRKALLLLLVVLGLTAFTVACESHPGMTLQGTVNYHCEKTDHGARWMTRYGDGTEQLANWENLQYRNPANGLDRCYGSFLYFDGPYVLIAWDVNMHNEVPVMAWVAQVWYPSESFAPPEFVPDPADPSLENIVCRDATAGERETAASAGITLPPDCYALWKSGSLPAGETPEQFLALDPETN